MVVRKTVIAAIFVIAIIGIAAFFGLNQPTGTAVSNEEGFPIYLFYAQGCPHCADEKAFLSKIQDQYNIKILEYDISKNTELYKDFLTRYNVPRTRWGSVPALFIDKDYIIGYGTDKTTGAKIEAMLQKCPQACISPAEKKESEKGEATNYEATEAILEGQEHTLSLFGREIKIGVSTPLIFLAILLALVDGINPCTFIVMLILLGYLVGVGSKKLVLKAGLVFISVVYIIYALFMYGIFNIMIIVPFLEKIKLAVAVFALFAGGVFIKDFFFLNKWFSLKIPGSAAPILNKLKRTTSIAGVAILAAFASLVEMPCTAGFPVIYTTVMADRAVSTASSIAYILWYNIFYVIPLFVLIGLVYWAQLKVEDMEAWRQKAARWMRLVGGLVMLGLGLAILGGAL